MLQTSSHIPVSRRGFLAGALSLAGAPLVAAMPGQAPSWTTYAERLSERLTDAGGGKFDPDFAQALLTETNTTRLQEGLDALQWDEGFAIAARAHVADMFSRGYFEHQSPEGFGHVDRVALLNRDFCGQTTENLAWRSNQSQATHPKKIQAMWEASAGHRENLLDPTSRRAGFGAVRIGGTIYVAGVYGDVAVRLGQALPFVLRSREELDAVIATATPHIERLSLTPPRTRATWMMQPGQALPALGDGVWQLRPLRMSGETRYQVLAGPLFQMGLG